MNSTLGYKLEYISLALFLGYGAVVLTGILPLSILDPNWQLKLCSVLVQNAPLALVGIAILHVAAYLDGRRPSLRARQAFVSRWSIVVALGFFLLVPLQASSAWRVFASSVQGQNGGELAVLNRRFEGMRRAINSATSPTELQARLNAAGGPTLSAADIAAPLPILRPRLLSSLEQAQNKAKEQLSRSKPSIVWTLMQRTFHVVVSALGYGLAFAASAQRQDSELTRLQEWKMTRRRRHNLLDATHGDTNQHKNIFAIFENWKTRRADKYKPKRPIAVRSKKSNLDDKAYIKEILKQEEQIDDS